MAIRAKPSPAKFSITGVKAVGLIAGPMEVEMTQVFFHCSTARKVFLDPRGAVVNDLAEARDHAARLVQSFTSELSLEDWRDWVMHVNDDQGDELFVVPFTFVLGKAH